jgi:hypothetical protein
VARSLSAEDAFRLKAAAVRGTLLTGRLLELLVAAADTAGAGSTGLGDFLGGETAVATCAGALREVIATAATLS